MTTEHKDHWETLFDSTYLRWFDLEDYPALVEIVKVDRLVPMTLRGGAKKKSSVLHYQMVQGKIEESNQKPLVLNRTNTESIVAICGNMVPEWAGKTIVLFKTTTKLKGRDVNCIRIRAPKN